MGVGPDSPKISAKVDVWSCGVIVYQMLLGKKPFGNDMSQQSLLANNIIKPGVRVTFPAKPALPADAKVALGAPRLAT